MEQVMKEIKIEDFITIKILDLSLETCVYFVNDYNEKHFYMTDDNELYTHKSIDIYYNCYDLYFQKARIVHRDNLDKLKKYVYDLHRKLTVKIGRAEKGEYYYIIDISFGVEKCEEQNDDTDDFMYNTFNYFLSKEEAVKYAQKLQQYLINLRKEEYCNE